MEESVGGGRLQLAGWLDGWKRGSLSFYTHIYPLTPFQSKENRGVFKNGCPEEIRRILQHHLLPSLRTEGEGGGGWGGQMESIFLYCCLIRGTH